MSKFETWCTQKIKSEKHSCGKILLKWKLRYEMIFVERKALKGDRTHVPDLQDLNRGYRLSSQWIRTSLLLVPTCPGGLPIQSQGQVGISSNDVRIHCELSLHPLFKSWRSGTWVRSPVKAFLSTKIIPYHNFQFRSIIPHELFLEFDLLCTLSLEFTHLFAWIN